MTLAHDLYAETNPAFCVYALAAFINAYVQVNEIGPEMPLAYIALPIALSEDLAGSFKGTNKRTGLLEWLERTPQMSLGFGERVNASLHIVTPAVRYGCSTQIFILGVDGRLRPGTKRVKAAAVGRLDTSSAGVIRRAGRLGAWLATAGSTRNIFGILGLTV
ncbi:three component ABC system middle component [uncultured Salinisphaera sp.]|uniref:three component ABC system middle component n=1 Tax=uncultured Salinisphaera sp. TaxID=359372 RepID=UPI0032B21580